MTDLSAALSMSQLAKLAQSKNPQKRDKLFLALGSLCAQKPLDETPQDSAFCEIMFLLNKDASKDARQQVANLLCEKDWSPRSLVLAWAIDEVPVANPVLLKSPVLTDDDLVTVAKSSSLFHRIAIADRPEITEKITSTLAHFSEPEVLIAMTGNTTATMTMETFASCVRVSRRHDALRLKLADRSDLPRSLIPSLFAYSSTEERKKIAVNFNVDVEKFSDIVRQAVLAKSVSADDTTIYGTRELEIARLVSKLSKAGKLTPAFAIRAASENKIPLFEHAICSLADIPLEQFRSALSRSPTMTLALACHAARLERAVFPSLHRNLQARGYFTEPLTEEITTKAAQAFSSHSPAGAAVALRLLASNNT